MTSKTTFRKKNPAIHSDNMQPADVEMNILSNLCQIPDKTLPLCRATGVERDWFSDSACALLWELFSERIEQRQPLDIISLIRALQNIGKLTLVGGPPVLFECLLGPADFHHLPVLLNILRTNHYNRQQIRPVKSYHTEIKNHRRKQHMNLPFRIFS